MHADIAVLGAGPAGAVVARCLQNYGYRVLVIHQPRRFNTIEGLSERARAGLSFAGFENTLAAIDHPVARGAYWNGSYIQANTEWIVERDVFDAALLSDLKASSIALTTARVKNFTRTDGHWQIELNQEDAIHAGFIIDARGRAAPHSGQNLQRGPLSIALSRFWQLPVNAEPMTQVMAFDKGWCWYAARASATGSIQIVTSSETERLPAKTQLADFYKNTLQYIPELQPLLENAAAKGEITARYAQPQYTVELITLNHARVGDAAFAIDPLSGHGIYEAIGGALALAASVNTMLSRPADADIAQRFYRERIENDFLRMARIGRDFYRQEQRWPEQLFWQERQHWPDDKPAHPVPDQSKPRVESRPVNINGLIEQKEVMVTADHPRGIWQIAGVTLVPLWRHLQDIQTSSTIASTAQIIDDYALHNKLDLRSCHTAFTWLTTRGLIA